MEVFGIFSVPTGSDKTGERRAMVTIMAIFRQHFIMGPCCSQFFTAELSLKTTQWGQFEPHFTDEQTES